MFDFAFSNWDRILASGVLAGGLSYGLWDSDSSLLPEPSRNDSIQAHASFDENSGWFMRYDRDRNASLEGVIFSDPLTRESRGLIDFYDHGNDARVLIDSYGSDDGYSMNFHTYDEDRQNLRWRAGAQYTGIGTPDERLIASQCVSNLVTSDGQCVRQETIYDRQFLQEVGNRSFQATSGAGVK